MILLAGLLVLGGAAYILEKPFAEKPEGYATYGLIFPDFDVQQAREIFIRRGDKEVIIQHSPQGWIVPTLFDHPAKFSKIQEVVSRVSRWKNDLPAGRSAAKHDRLAVGEETGTYVSISDANKKTIAEFYLGRMGGFDKDRLPPGGKIDPEAITFYIRPLPGDAIYLLTEFLLGTFTHQPENWIDGKIFTYAADDVVKVVAEGIEETLVITREGEEWRLEGLEHPPSQSAIKQVVDSVGYLSATNVGDPNAPPSEYGLDVPIMTATVTLKDGSEAQIIIGKEKDERSRYAKSVGGRYPIILNTSSLDRIFKTKNDLVEKKLFSFSGYQAKKVTLEHPDESVIIEKEENQWKVTSPEGHATDLRAISQIVGRLGQIKIERYVEQAGEDLSKFGLGVPSFRAITEIEDETHILIVGGQDPDGLHYAMKAGGEWVVLLTDETLSFVRKRADDLRERTPEEIAAEAAAKKAEATPVDDAPKVPTPEN
ncbi:MAG: DUF4340 domain-containing protein, partial [Planctomycetota bacterium]|nr:DUF4340 domain-containing protein [Planctomycetota bacterium]